MSADTIVTREVKLYAEAAESWRRDHNDAMACMQLEQLLNLAIHAYDAAIEVDESWRSLVMAGKAQFDQARHDEIRNLFVRWLAPRQQVAGLIRELQDKGYVVEYAAEFYRRVREAEWSLKPAKDAFDHGGFHAMRDIALDDHEAGRTQPL